MTKFEILENLNSKIIKQYKVQKFKAISMNLIYLLTVVVGSTFAFLALPLLRSWVDSYPDPEVGKLVVA